MLETLERQGKPPIHWRLEEAIKTLESHLTDEANFQKLIQRQNTISEGHSLGMDAILVELEARGCLDDANELVGDASGDTQAASRD